MLCVRCNAELHTVPVLCKCGMYTFLCDPQYQLVLVGELFHQQHSPFKHVVLTWNHSTCALLVDRKHFNLPHNTPYTISLEDIEKLMILA